MFGVFSTYGLINFIQFLIQEVNDFPNSHSYSLERYSIKLIREIRSFSNLLTSSIRFQVMSTARPLFPCKVINVVGILSDVI